MQDTNLSKKLVETLLNSLSYYFVAFILIVFSLNLRLLLNRISFFAIPESITNSIIVMAVFTAGIPLKISSLIQNIRLRKAN